MAGRRSGHPYSRDRGDFNERENSGFRQSRSLMSESLNPFTALRPDNGMMRSKDPFGGPQGIPAPGMMRSMDTYGVPQGVSAPGASMRGDDVYAGQMNPMYAGSQAPARMQGREFAGAMLPGREMMHRGGRDPVGTDDLRPQAIEEDRGSPVPETQLLHDFQVLLDKIIETTPSKQVIYLRPCILYPPPPGAAPVTIKDRPPGCKTVFVGGLPRNITRDILLEVFETCRVANIRMDGDFAYIRFRNEADVEKAVQISGYRMVIRSRDEEHADNVGILHVDYARDEQDLREWESQQRSLMQVHHGRHDAADNNRRRSSSPSQLMLCMNPESLLEKIRIPESFGMSLEVLHRWLDRGECTQQSGGVFFNLLQSVHSQIKVIGGERSESKREYLMARQRYRARHKTILHQFEQIDRVFGAATKQKVWDNFSKPQRRLLENWRKECSEHRATLEAESLRDQWADEEDDGKSSKRSRRDERSSESSKKVEKENETLRCQLEAYKNEVDLLKVELRESNEQRGGGQPDSQLQVLQQAVQGMQEQLLKSTGQMQSESVQMFQEKMLTRAGGFSDWDMRCIALSASFLSLLPEGASADYVLTYIQHAGVKCSSGQLQGLLERCPSVFRRDTGTIENRFRCIAFGHDN